MTVLPVQTRKARYWALELALPSRPPVHFGILLLDESSDELHLRLRPDAADLAAEEDAEVLEALAADLEGKAREMGGRRLLDLLEDSLSNVLRVSAPETV